MTMFVLGGNRKYPYRFEQQGTLFALRELVYVSLHVLIEVIIGLPIVYIRFFSKGGLE